MNKWIKIVLVVWVLSVWFTFIVILESVFEGSFSWLQMAFTLITTLVLVGISEVKND